MTNTFIYSDKWNRPSLHPLSPSSLFYTLPPPARPGPSPALRAGVTVWVTPPHPHSPGKRSREGPAEGGAGASFHILLRSQPGRSGRRAPGAGRGREAHSPPPAPLPSPDVHSVPRPRPRAGPTLAPRRQVPGLEDGLSAAGPAPGTEVVPGAPPTPRTSLGWGSGRSRAGEGGREGADQLWAPAPAAPWSCGAAVRRRSRARSTPCRSPGSRPTRSRRPGCRSPGRRAGRSRRTRRSRSSSSRGTSPRSCRSRTWRSPGRCCTASGTRRTGRTGCSARSSLREARESGCGARPGTALPPRH